MGRLVAVLSLGVYEWVWQAGVCVGGVFVLRGCQSFVCMFVCVVRRRRPAEESLSSFWLDEWGRLVVLRLVVSIVVVVVVAVRLLLRKTAIAYMRVASYLYAYPEFVYLALLFASVSGAFTAPYRAVSTRICIRNTIVSVSAPTDWSAIRNIRVNYGGGGETYRWGGRKKKGGSF